MHTYTTTHAFDTDRMTDLDLCCATMVCSQRSHAGSHADGPPVVLNLRKVYSSCFRRILSTTSSMFVSQPPAQSRCTRSTSASHPVYDSPRFTSSSTCSNTLKLCQLSGWIRCVVGLFFCLPGALNSNATFEGGLLFTGVKNW